MSVTQYTTLSSAGIITPTVNSPTQTDSSVSLSWGAVSGATYYDIFGKPVSGSRVFKSTVSGATSTIITGLDPSTTYYWEVYANNSAGLLTQATLASVLPALNRYSILGGSMSLGNNLTNDGTLWFWPDSAGSPQPGTITADVLNPESASIIETTGILLATSDPYAPFVQFGVLDSGTVWRQNRSIPSPGASGTWDSPKITKAVIDLSTNPIPGNGTIKIQQVLGVGEFTQCSNFSTSTNPNTISNIGFTAGDVGGTTPTYSTPGIGPFLPNIVCKHSNTYPSKLNVCVFGDSTTAQIRPWGSTNQDSLEGYVYFANNLARTNSKNIRYSSFGQGTATWDQYTSRLLAALTPLLVPYFGLVLVQVATYNQQFASTADANSRWSAWLSLKSTIEAAGLKTLPLIMTPAGAGNSSGNIDGYTQMRSLVSAAGGIDLINSISTNGVDITATYSEDNVHINEAGISLQGTAFHNQVYAAAQTIGWGI